MLSSTLIFDLDVTVDWARLQLRLSKSQSENEYYITEDGMQNIPETLIKKAKLANKR